MYYRMMSCIICLHRELKRLNVHLLLCAKYVFHVVCERVSRYPFMTIKLILVLIAVLRLLRLDIIGLVCIRLYMTMSGRA